MPAIPAPHQPCVARSGPNPLLAQAQSLIRVLPEEDPPAERTKTELLELIVDGYAHVLALDVAGRKLERDIARLAGSGDPEAAAELRKLSARLRELTSTSEQLRNLLGEARLRHESRGRH